MSTASRATTCRRGSNGRRSCSRARSCNTRRGSMPARGFLDRWIAAGRGDAPCLIGPAETLTYGELDAAGEPDRQRPHRQARARAGRPRAPARRQHADVGRGLLRGAEGRRRRRRDDADAAGARDRLPARQGEDQARALRSPAVGGAGEGASARARPRANRLLGRRGVGRLRGADGRRLAALRGGRDRGRRRLPHRLHLRHHRRAEGHDAFPPRPRRDLRRLLRQRAPSRAVGPLHRLAAARLHLRPRRRWRCSRCMPAPRPC